MSFASLIVAAGALALPSAAQAQQKPADAELLTVELGDVSLTNCLSSWPPTTASMKGTG
jgi:hypothetical protein